MVAKLNYLTNIDTAMQSILGPLSNCRKEEQRLSEAKGKKVVGLMFPDSTKGTRFSTIEELENDLAKRICWGTETGKECPVRVECLEYARRNRENFGVWGGFGTQERIRLFRRQRRQSAS